MAIRIVSFQTPGRASVSTRRLGLLGVVFALMAAAVLGVLALATFGLLRGLSAGARRGRGSLGRPEPSGGAVGHGDAAVEASGVRRVDSGTADAAGPAGAGARRREPSSAEVLDAWPVAFLLAGALALGALAMGAAPAQAKWLVPMDDKQTDHLRAYGLTFWALTQGAKCEWELNYRGGSFLLPDGDPIEREANIRGVTIEPMSGSAEALMRAEIADNNMESVVLEKAPKIAVYIPPNTPPWDDAVTLALKYADIPYATVWDEEVLRGQLYQYDWIHLHHEDFTGQHGKFYQAYHNFPWYKEEEAVQSAMAHKLGFAKVTQLKAAVAVAIKDYMAKGGFMFGMCSATDTYDIALAAEGVDIVDYVYDGDGVDPQAQQKLDFSRTLAFKNFHIDTDPMMYHFSDIDVTQEATLRGPKTVFTLFDFSAKNDPVPCMLVQDHVSAVPEFLGQSTGFRRSTIKSGVLELASVDGTDEVKYLHGQFGRGTFTFLGGHDPEDYQHMVGDPPTDLSRYKHSPGYRLILNNVLFPAAEKKKQRT
jgi:hypothetical protein